MLTAIALTPSAPVLVPELAGAAAAEVAGIRAAAIEAASALPDQWIAVGVGPQDMVITRTRGTFAGYGADVEVALCPDAPGPVADLPLCAVFAGWLRGQANPQAAVSVRVHRHDLSAEESVARGRLLRDLVDAEPEPIGILVVADGCKTLGPSAPGGEDPDAQQAQSALDDALATGDTAALTRLPDGVVGRVAYQVLAGLVGTGPRSAQELFRGAPFGVGYFVGAWSP